MIHPCPKPAPRTKKPKHRLPPPRKPIAKSTKPIRKQNPVAKAKRVKRYKKEVIGGADYKKAKAEAMERASLRLGYPVCEYAKQDIVPPFFEICEVSEGLQAHHLRYPKTRKIEASDLKMLCKYHHEIEEAKKPHKQNRIGF